MHPTTRLAALFALFACTTVAAAPRHDGELDPAYAAGGQRLVGFPVDLPIERSGYTLSGPLLQADGKLVVVGSAYSDSSASGSTDFGVIRLLPDGSFDSKFGADFNGGAHIDFAGGDAHASGAALAADGNIVVAGWATTLTSNDEDMAVIRLTRGGIADPTFGNAGRVLVPFDRGGTQSDLAYRVNLDNAGYPLLVGYCDTATGRQLALARLTRGGALDTRFGDGGRVTLDFGGDQAQGFQVRQLHDGQHIVAVGGGNASAGGALVWAMAKFDANGDLDTSFGDGGKLRLDTVAGAAFDFLELTDGRLLVCGDATGDFACIRFLADGTLDLSYTPAVVAFDPSANNDDIPYAMQRDGLGRIVLAGVTTVGNGNNYDFAVARLNPDGSLDDHFGQGGIASFPGVEDATQTDYNNAATGVAIAPDGAIYLTGIADTSPTGPGRFQVMRLVGDTIFTDDFEDN